MKDFKINNKPDRKPLQTGTYKHLHNRHITILYKLILNYGFYVVDQKELCQDIVAS